MKEISIQIQLAGKTAIPPRDSRTKVGLRGPKPLRKLICYIFEDRLQMKPEQGVFVEFPVPQGVFFVECQGIRDGYRIVFP